MGQCGSSYNYSARQPSPKEALANKQQIYQQYHNHKRKDVRARSNNLSGNDGFGNHRRRDQEVKHEESLNQRLPRNPPHDHFVPASIQKATPSGRENKPAPKKLIYDGDKYCYQANKEKWLKISVKVAIEAKHFNQGGMRLAYRCEELDEKDNSRIFSCAKVFKDKEGPQAYFDEAMTQMVAESYAQEFNRECASKGLKYNVGFVPVSVLHLKTPEGRRLLYNLEPMLKGKYRKHNDNDGHVETNLLLPQAFSHYTYERSNNLLVVVDIQGVGSFYTDPQIHSFDGEGFGLGNLGFDGLTSFLKTHECNQICRLLSLPPVTVKETDYEMAKRLQSEENKAANPSMRSPMITSVRYKKEINNLIRQSNEVTRG